MTIWQALEIEPTRDKKTIKRAYAKKLKVCRPDQDPEAFQQLHEAYKAALEWCDQAISVQPEPPLFEPDSHSLELPETHEPPIQPDPYADTQVLDYSQLDSAPPVAEPSVNEPVSDEQKNDVYSVFDRDVDGLINDETLFFRVKLWRKLFESEGAEELLADLSYKLTVSTWVFGWALYKQSQDAPLSRHLLRYFAEFFQWQSYQKRLNERFGYGMVEQMLEYIDQTVVVDASEPDKAASTQEAQAFGELIEHYRSASLLRRLQAMFVDIASACTIAFVSIFVVIFLTTTFFELPESSVSLLMACVIIAAFLGRYGWLAGCNPGPGQHRAGLAMVDASGRWPSVYRLRLRAVVLLLGLPVLALSLPANILCYLFTRRYLHDIASGIRVIDLNKPVHANKSPFDT